MESYAKLTISGKTQVLMKVLGENQYHVTPLPAVEIAQVTEAEHRQLEVEIPLSFHDSSRYSIKPVLAIRKGLASVGLPPYYLIIDAPQLAIIGWVPEESLSDVTSFCNGSSVYFVAWDGSANFPTDEQWFSHAAVRAVIREWKARDRTWTLLK
jgi:hypothetical protein